MATRRREETSEERQQRLERLRQAVASTRAQENTEQREQRLENRRQADAIARAHERENANRLAYEYDKESPLIHSEIGKMDMCCPHCGAMKFRGETQRLCCGGGAISLQLFPRLPSDLEDLTSGMTPESKHFLANIRKYNSCFSMTSFGHKEAVVSGWNPSFRIQGQAFHLIGSLLPDSDNQPKFLQVFS